MYVELCFTNIQFTKNNKNCDERIRFDIKSMFNIKTRKLITFDNVFIKKTFVNKIKLQCSRQKITYSNNISKNFKNIYKKSIKNENLYES